MNKEFRENLLKLITSTKAGNIYGMRIVIMLLFGKLKVQKIKKLT